jgi:translation initiation factor IF-1
LRAAVADPPSEGRPRGIFLLLKGRVSKEELVHLDGEVVLIAKGGNFRVKLDNGHEVLAKLAGKVRRHRIRVVLGDRVTVAVSPYDPTRGFIVYRQR